MNYNGLWALGLGLLFSGAFASCSDDNEYNSEIPRFTELEVKSLDGSEAITTGKPFVALPVEGTSGKLLDRTNYQWTSTPTGLTHKMSKSPVVYGTEGSMPSDTIVASSPGTYTLTFRAEYQVSGLNLNYNETQETPEGAKITYKTLSWQKYEVTITKKLHIK